VLSLSAITTVALLSRRQDVVAPIDLVADSILVTVR
jgi:hypothetical protein